MYSQKEVAKLSPRLKNVLHILSVLGTYMMLFGFLFIIQMAIFGFLPVFKDIYFFGIPFSGILFTFTSLLFIMTRVKISSPYKTR